MKTPQRWFVALHQAQPLFCSTHGTWVQPTWVRGHFSRGDSLKPGRAEAWWSGGNTPQVLPAEEDLSSQFARIIKDYYSLALAIPF